MVHCFIQAISGLVKVILIFSVFIYLTIVSIYLMKFSELLEKVHLLYEKDV